MANLPVFEAGNYRSPIATASPATFKGDGQGFPTGRLLNGTDDHGMAEEWAERGTVEIEGKPVAVQMIYLFAASDIEGMDEPENYPWSHCAARFVIVAE